MTRSGPLSGTSARRLRARWIVAATLAAVILANESVTRGHLTDGDGRPVPGADVWLADSTRVVHRVRTDSAGYFRVVHAPFARRGYQLLICEGRRRLFVDAEAGSAVVRTEYGIGAYTGRFPDVPADRGWVAEVPPSCPVASVVRDGGG